MINYMDFTGSDGVVHTWDMRMRRCLSRAVDEGCFCSTSLAASPDGRLYATGSKAGVVNIYNRSQRCHKHLLEAFQNSRDLYLQSSKKMSRFSSRVNEPFADDLQSLFLSSCVLAGPWVHSCLKHSHQGS